jgi:exodeoxyribonuclease VII small subunit
MSEAVQSQAVESQAPMFEPSEVVDEVRGARVAGVTATAGSHEGEGRELEQITFEQGYEELKGIVARLDDPELPIHEMFEGFRRGKGLERTLRAYLQEREGELAELEAGNNLVEFEIVAPSDPAR